MADQPPSPVSPKEPSHATAAETIPEPNNTSAAPSLSSAEHNNEKRPAQASTALDLDRVGETDGYVLDEAKLREKFGLAPDVPLKKSARGDVLIPQPTDDPEDPLNWSRWKKAAILLVIGVNAATSDYSAATGASALIPQAQHWRIDPNKVNHATAGMTFMCKCLSPCIEAPARLSGRLLFYLGNLKNCTNRDLQWALVACE
jgi:hypothetical protein